MLANKQRVRLAAMLALAICGLLASSCDNQDSPTETSTVELEFADVSWEFGSALQVAEPATRVFRTQVEWSTFWASQTGRLAENAPVGDFSETMLVGLFWGGGFDGCDRIIDVVQSVRVADSWIRVEVAEMPWLGPCRAIQEPLQIIQLASSNRPVEVTDYGPRVFDIRVLVEPDRSEYRPTERIQLTATNESEGHVFLWPCPFNYETLVDGQWRHTDLDGGIICEREPGDLLVAHPGRRVHLPTVPIAATTAPGVFRISVHVQRYDLQSALTRTYESRVFEVVAPGTD